MPNQDQPITTNTDTPSIQPAQVPPPMVSTEPIADFPPPPMVVSSEAGTSPAGTLPLPETPTTGTDQTLPPLNISPIVVTGGNKGGLGGKMGRKGFVATILGLLLMIGGIGAGLYLTGQKQEIREKAFIPVGDEATVSCLEIRVYKVEGVGTDSENWTRLSADDLKKLKAGDEIYLVAVGQSNSTETNGGFIGAKFSVNGVTRPETTKIRMPSSPDGTTNTHLIYDIYAVPTGTTNFNITAQIHHSSGWF